MVQRGARHRDALDHPTRQCPDGLVRSVDHRDGAELLLDALGRHVVQAGVVAQVLACGQLSVEQRLVAEQSDPSAHPPRVFGEICAPSTLTAPE